LALVAGVVTVLALIASGAGLIALQKQHEAESQALALAAQCGCHRHSPAFKDETHGAQNIIVEVLANRPCGAVGFRDQRVSEVRADAGPSSGHGGPVVAAFRPMGAHRHFLRRPLLDLGRQPQPPCSPVTGMCRTAVFSPDGGASSPRP
jgi:hypothetical protein